ncbi:MAG: hypothetical protein WB766_09980 [Roseiarcus sp.]
MTQAPGVGDRLIIRLAARFGLRGIFAGSKTLERSFLFETRIPAAPMPAFLAREALAFLKNY